MPILWTFKCYATQDGQDIICEWYGKQTAKVRAKLDVRLDFLAQRERREWKREPFDMLHGVGAGLGEVRFKADTMQYRMLGFFGPGRMEFTMVLPAIEKGGKFIPREACAIAQRRMAEIEKDGSRARACECFDLQ